MKYDSNHRTLSLAVFIGLTAIICVLASQATAQQLVSPRKVARFAQQQGSSNEAAVVMFKSGRDMVSSEQWSQAEQVFGQYVAQYPKEKDADAALYWKAYAEYKLRRLGQARVTLDQLLNDYQNSSWKEDARTLMAQLPGGYAQVEKEKAKEKEKEGRGGVGYGVGMGIGAGRNGDPTSDDDPCEFKIVVLQTLIESDPQRGLAVATDWLKAGSTQTVRCKSAALGLLARRGGKAATPVILDFAQHETDLKLRARAISVLGATSDDSVIDALRDFAMNAQQPEISEAAFYALREHTGPRAVTVLTEIAMSNKPIGLRRAAISSIAGRSGDPSVDALFKIYDGDQNIDIRKSVIAGFANRRSERAGAKLLEIARGSENIELRKTAVSAIARRDRQQAIEPLLSLYGSEKNEELKDQILNSIGYSNDPRVVHKLIEIARNPQEPMEHRKRAIGWLSRSKDPEVLKLLEDLLKQ
jgi:HEAT repeat protein